MSLSNAERLANLNHALRLLMNEVGQRWIKVAPINPRAETYKGVSETTWLDLKSRFFIQDTLDARVLLTGYGWEAGLGLVGVDSADTRERLGRIFVSLESAVRLQPSAAGICLVKVQDVAAETALDECFVQNVIEARLIEHWLNRRGATLTGFKGRIIVVPPDFGSQRL